MNTLLHRAYCLLTRFLYLNRINVAPGNSLTLRGVVLKRVRITIRGSGNRVVFHPGALVKDMAVKMKGDNLRLEVGSGCILGAGRIEVLDSNCAVEIGPGTVIYDTVIGAAEEGTSVRIGRDCLFAPRTEIRTTDAHSIFDQATGERINKGESITIGDNVWLASEATVLKGAFIGNGSIIGYRSVVTSAIPANSLAVGIPARVVRGGVSWGHSR